MKRIGAEYNSFFYRAIEQDNQKKVGKVNSKLRSCA